MCLKGLCVGVYKHKYSYCTKWRKGIVTTKNCKKRKKFVNTVTNILRSDFWTNCESFYFDGVIFTHKYSPLEEAHHCKNKAWWLRSEGLSRTGNGKKEGTGGRSASFPVGISYKKGLIICIYYFGRLSGESIAKIVKKDFPKAFRDSINPKNELFLQDGDPIQNSKKANRAFDATGCKVFAIPARSLDVNPIENIFNRIREKLTEDAITHQIKRENLKSFLPV